MAGHDKYRLVHVVNRVVAPGLIGRRKNMHVANRFQPIDLVGTGIVRPRAIRLRRTCR
jgi:hypothetical protein